MWKFQEFSITHILAEINFGKSSSKIANFCNFRSCVFYQFGTFQPSKSAKMPKNQDSDTGKVLKWQF